MNKPIYLTEAFKAAHPAGTRVRHPLHGTAKIIEVHPTHIVVEWESPLARIEQSDQIVAAEVPYMSRMVNTKNVMESVNTKTLNFNEALKG